MKMVKKAKRLSKIARGRFARSLVLKGDKEKTIGGLTRDMLIKNKRGKVVSKRASAHGKRMYKQIESWTEAVMEARDSIKVQGFIAINGKSLQGKAIYVKAKALHRAKRAQAAGSSEQ